MSGTARSGAGSIPYFGTPAAIAPLVALAAILIFAAFVRLRLADAPLERDEGEYAYAGQLILHGFPPYVHAYNMKFPGVYYAYAAVMALLGRTPWGIHAGLLAVNAACILLVFILGKRLAGAFSASIAAITFGLLSLSQSILGVFAHATHFAVLCALAGFVALIPEAGASGAAQAVPGGAVAAGRSASRGRSARLLLGGTGLGLAVLMKQHAIFLLLWGAVWVVRDSFTQARVGALVPKRSDGGATAAGNRSHGPASLAKAPMRTGPEEGTPEQARPAPSRAGLALRAIGVFLIGAAAPFLLMCALFAWQGVLGRFWFWTFGYAREYVSQVPVSAAVGLLARGVADLTRDNLLLWIAALPGLVLLWTGRRTAREREFETGLFAASFLSVCPGFYFRQHYFVLMLPAVALCAGAAFDALRGALTTRGMGETTAGGIPAAVFAAAVLIGLAPQREFLFLMDPVRASRATYGANPFPESLEIARYIREHSSAEDRIAVLGSEPQIYFYADRLSATGYIYAYPLMEHQRYARGMQDEMIREIGAAHPAWLIFVRIPTSWLVRPDSDKEILDWSERYAAKCYDVAGIADIHAVDHTTYVWGDEARRYKPKSDNLVVVFKRKEDGRPCGVAP